MTDMMGSPVTLGTDPETGERMGLFYGGPFSQWYMNEMEIDGVQYNCAEQYMMGQKARLFGDLRLHDRIMASGHPAEQKALGKEVGNFIKPLWEAVAKDVVRTANMAKFSDPKLKAILLWTGDRTIVEASPTDVIWGIGLAEWAPSAFTRSKWRGSNWLGDVLMDVRRAMR